MKNLHRGYTHQMSNWAQEKVEAYLVRNKDLYIFGSEKACRRVLNHLTNNNTVARLDFAIDPWYQYYITVPDYH